MSQSTVASLYLPHSVHLPHCSPLPYKSATSHVVIIVVGEGSNNRLGTQFLTPYTTWLGTALERVYTPRLFTTSEDTPLSVSLSLSSALSKHLMVYRIKKKEHNSAYFQLNNKWACWELLYFIEVTTGYLPGYHDSWHSCWCCVFVLCLMTFVILSWQRSKLAVKSIQTAACCYCLCCCCCCRCCSCCCCYYYCCCCSWRSPLLFNKFTF